MIWNEAKECMSRDEMTALQSARLRKLVNRVYHNVESYRRKMQAIGLEPGDIRGIEDLNKLPFTTKDDLRDNYPFGLFAVPESEILRVHASSGTTGKATVVGYTRRDIEIWSECVTRCLAMAGIGKNDRIMVAYGYGLFTGGLGLHYGAENLGAMVIPASTSSTTKQLQLMEDFKATAIACTPSYLVHLMETLKAENRLDKIYLKSALCGAEPWTEAMRTRLEEGLNIQAHDIYGLSEIMGPGVSTDCRYHAGSHIMEDYFLPEVVDCSTFENLPDGETGELVITTLSKEALPMIRYRTKDLTSLTHEKCACGRTTARISRFKGRSDDMLIIRGVNVFPSQIEAALLEMGGTTPHYLIVVDRVNEMDTFEVWVELDESMLSDEVRVIEGLAKKINHVLRQALGLNPVVKLVQANTIERSNGKAKRVIDRRKLY